MRKEGLQMDNNTVTTDQQTLTNITQANISMAKEAKAVEMKKQEEAKVNEMRKQEERFHMFGAGSFFYALFYAFCLYRNASGITYPFFAGGTLLFFGYFIKKSENSSAEEKREKTKAHINKKFLMISIVIAGGLNCTTDSGVLIFFNKLLMLVLFGVLLLQCWHDLTGWSITAYIKGGMTMLFGGICNMITPAGDLAACRRLKHLNGKESEKNASRGHLIKSVGIGLLIVIPMAMFIAILLASADEIFGRLLYNILTFSIDIDAFEDVIKIILLMIIVFAACYGLFTYNVEQQNIKTIDNMALKEKTNWDSYIAVTVNGVMSVMYIAFSGIQIIGLFFGKLPEGYTYSSYARHGFFELVFVCLFNIVLVLCTLAYFESSRILRVLLTIICGCTYIMTGSSAYRMLLYIASYRLTFLRLLVLWGLVMIVIVMTGVLVYIYNQKFSLFRFGLIVMTAGWLCFSALHPDYWIASYNIMAGTDEQEYDSYYLTKQLSLDAVLALPEEIYTDDSSSYYARVKQYKKQTDGLMGVRKFNFSRAYAAHKMNL